MYVPDVSLCCLESRPEEDCPELATLRAQSNVGKVTNLFRTEQERWWCGGVAEGVQFN